MKNIFITAALIAVSVATAHAQEKSVTTPSPASEKPATVAVAAKTTEKLGNVMKAGQPVCPIMGEAFTQKATSPKSTYKGKTYVFCCEGCKPEFDKTPAKYVTEAKPAAKPTAKTTVKPAKKKV